MGQVVELLAGEWRGIGPLDLTHLLVIVPTRQSGRRLREALAEYASPHQAAVFPPRVMLPESLMSAGESEDVATRLESLLAWSEVFCAVELDDFREVFPVDPPARSFAWAFGLAESFVRLQRTLAEAGLRLGDVAARAGADFPEVERWRQIGALEAMLHQRLARAGLRDAPDARIAAVENSAGDANGRDVSAPANEVGADLLCGIERVFVVASPDPQPLALHALATVARRVPVELVVFAPETEANAFDCWGRPRSDVWSERILALPEFERHVHLCADPAAQASRIAALAHQYGEPEGILGVGVADPELLPLLERELEQAGQTVFNPEGRARRGDRLFQLLQACAGLARDDSFAAVETIARCPDFLEFLHDQLGSGFSAARFLRELDKLHTRHLPPTLGEAMRQTQRSGSENTGRDMPCGTGVPSEGSMAVSERRRESFATLLPALRLIGELRATLTTGEFPANAVEALTAMFRARRFDPMRDEDARAANSAETWTDVLREIARVAPRFDGIGNADWWDLALRIYGESVGYDEKSAGAVELQGWLELLWEDAPHLVVAGLNDGRVPEAIVGDPFLPESLRERLGLKTNAARFARDAYLLQAVAAWRGGFGCSAEKGDVVQPVRLDLVLGKTSVAGDPLRPSRLLLRCCDQALPERISQLFGRAETARDNPPWRRAWRLTPPTLSAAATGGRQASPPERVAVTSFRAWLACPFRFYLSRVLRMEAVDPAKTELDVFDFGTLCHSALEAMGREEGLRNETDPGRLREFLLERLEVEATRRFGALLTLPLVVQLESARQRLARAAEVQAQMRAEGWVIEQVERPFEIEVAGLVVAGKIDRIDRHESSGAIRVLDYKTSDRPVNPEQAHLRGLRREEVVPSFARFVYNAKECVWADLQLPLYLRAVGVSLETSAVPVGVERPIHCGYFNLPKAVGETGIQPWLNYTRELDAAAWSCAEGVATAIRAGEFWPPNEAVRAEQDDFASLIHHGVAASVAWEGAR